MNCKHLNDVLSQYAEGELPAKTQAKIVAHLRGDARHKPCAACSARLEMLQRALPLLAADAQKSVTPPRDLFPAFRERLVSPPAASVTGSYALAPRGQRQPSIAWLLALVAIPVTYAVLSATSAMMAKEGALLSKEGARLAKGEFFVPSFFPVDPQMIELEKALKQTHTGTLHTIQSLQGLSINHGGGYICEDWYKNNYEYQSISFFNGPPAKMSSLKRRCSSEDSISQQHFIYYTPGGVMLQWNTATFFYQRPYDAKLSWSPRYAENDNAEYGRKGILRSLQNVLGLLNASDKLNTVPLQTSYDMVNGRRVKKIYIWDLHTILGANRGRFNQADIANTAGVPSSGQTASKTSTPDRIAVWLDDKNRIYYVWNYYVASDGTQWASDAQIDYDPDASAWNMEPKMPQGMPVVEEQWTSDEDVSLDEPVTWKIKPDWLTMTPSEKQEVQTTVEQFSQAWGARDEKRLHSLVDLERPLEITCPDGRKNMSGEDVWRQDWMKKLNKASRWKDFHISFDFAFQADRPPTKTVPFQFKRLCTDTVLPGLNVLARIKATRADGTNDSFAANLYLVKRAGGWKVYQYEDD